MPTPASKTRAALQSAVDQGTFDFLVPFGPHRALLRPDEVSRCLGWRPRTVYQLIEEGRLEAHAITGRDKQRYQVTRRSVLLFLAETALYRGEDALCRAEHLLSSFSAAELSRLITTATRLRASL
ncbi:MAG: hypothetical protein PHQ12_04640 [Chthoniobacteraceae bacterium]|nr:hypothetical protein [Chthoniobacteraceae bacterium]